MDVAVAVLTLPLDADSSCLELWNQSLQPLREHVGLFRPCPQIDEIGVAFEKGHQV